MDYKETLLMPKTDLPIRDGLSNKEPQIQEEWDAEDQYHKALERNKGSETFTSHDGPPCVNGNLYMRHILNKILKDFTVRYKIMQGFYALYVLGWDTYGLPIEQTLTKKGVDRKKTSTAEFREECKEFILEQIELQKKDFRRLGIRGDPNGPYTTLKPEYEAAQIRIFGETADKDLTYKGKKPVYWSPSSESSLAEAEIEYHDKCSALIYVAFDVRDDKGVADADAKFIIWTTTSWTIPSNVAVTVHPELKYGQHNVNGERYIIAEALSDAVAEALDWNKASIKLEKEYVGKELECVVAQHPFLDRESSATNGDYVTTDAGIGCVHIAPGYGEDDYIVGQKYELPVTSPIDDKGAFTEGGGQFGGMSCDKANKAVTDLLTEKGALLKLDSITRSYPHDWRTKEPVIFRATPQWFTSISKVRQDILDAIESTNFKVDWSKIRIYNMVRDRGRWVISRQCVWGAPLPVSYAGNDEIIMTKETVDHVTDLFAKHGLSIWFERETKDLLPEGFTHPGSLNGTSTKETDITDVWFGSDSSHRGVLETEPELSFPADMYLEGSDQYHGWFNSFITTSVVTRGVPPYKFLLSHGFIMDGEGKKMNKSLGNVIVPNQVAKQEGADIARFWVSSMDYLADVRIPDGILKQISDVYHKIRSTLRFMLGNINDLNPGTDSIPESELLEVGRYLLNRLRESTAGMINNYENFDYLNIYQEVQNSINVELSNFHLDYGKNISHIGQRDSHIRRSMQTALYQILVNMTKLLASISTHIAEKVWSHTPHVKEESVHLVDMSKTVEADRALLDKWRTSMNLRDDVNRVLETARNEKVIGKPLGAKVTIASNDKFNASEFLTSFDALHQLFIVSQVKVVDKLDDQAAIYEHGDIVIEHADGEKCERCWNYSEDPGAADELTHLCP